MQVLFAGAHAITSTGVCSLRHAYLIQVLSIVMYFLLYRHYFRWNRSSSIGCLITVNAAMILGAYYG